MTVRPILFSGEMVRAILDGRKTQTRRLVTLPKRRSIKGEGMDWVKSIHQDGGGNWIAWSTDAPGTADFTKKAYPNGEGFPCPYGRAGDRLWVRETWMQTTTKELQPGVVLFRADGWEPKNKEYSPWRPSIFMPRWASRLTLEISGVRVERLQAISEDDCWHEGLRLGNRGLGMPGLKDDFQLLWDRINGKRAPWASNPWVWCVEFKRVTP